MMANVNRYDDSKVFENIWKFLILSDQFNGHVCNGLIHFVVFSNSRIQRCEEEDIPFDGSVFEKYLSRIHDKKRYTLF